MEKILSFGYVFSTYYGICFFGFFIILTIFSFFKTKTPIKWFIIIPFLFFWLFSGFLRYHFPQLIFPVLREISILVLSYIWIRNFKVSSYFSKIFFVFFLIFIGFIFITKINGFSMIDNYPSMVSISLSIGILIQIFEVKRTTIKRILITMFALFLVSSYFVVGTVNVSYNQLDKKGEFLIKTKDGVSKEDLTNSMNLPSNLLIINSTSIDNIFIADILDYFNFSHEYIKYIFEKSPLIEKYELNQRLFQQTNCIELFNDSLRKNQWNLDSLHIENFYCELKNIFPYNYYQDKVKIGLIDVNINSNHEDFEENGFIGNRNIENQEEHGTCVLGIMNAESNNGKGVSSMKCADNKYYSVNILRIDNIKPSKIDLIDKIKEAAGMGCKVICVTAGCEELDENDVLSEEINNIISQNELIIVCAAGNFDTKAKYCFPANIQGVVVVTAIDENKDLPYWANSLENIKYGVCAPGVDIYTTGLNNTYKHVSGTSFATPHVVALLAVAKSILHNKSNNEIIDLIINSGSETQNTPQTGKLINPLNFLKNAKSNFYSIQ